MELRDTSPQESRRVVLHVITGDGRWEFKVLKGICRKLNGKDKIVYSPISRIEKKTGIGCLDFLNELPGYYEEREVPKVLAIVDKEHVPQNLEKEVSSRVKLMAFREEINGRLYFMKVKSKGREIKAYLSISGEEKRIEEDISKLIKLRFRVEIPPEKKAIIDFLRENKREIGRKEIEDLIYTSKIEEIRKTIPWSIVLENLD